jgi:hypothetical protein
MDLFGRPTSPSIFIVYAHDNDEPGDARAECVKYLIEWLLKIRSRVLSDRSPLQGTREGGAAAARNILSNQFCILPSDTDNNKNLKIESVDQVIVCGSDKLEHYCKHEFTSGYVNKLVSYYKQAAKQNIPRQNLQDQIREIVERSRMSDGSFKPGFHHVLTELAFLQIRRSYHDQNRQDGHEGPGIIPVDLSGDSGGKGMHYLSFLDICDLFPKFDNSQSSSLQHKLFFNVLKRLHANNAFHTRQVIDLFWNCYQNASRKLRGHSKLTKGIFGKIAFEEISKTQAELLELGVTEFRDEEWRKNWTSQTKSGWYISSTGIVDYRDSFAELLCQTTALTERRCKACP